LVVLFWARLCLGGVWILLSDLAVGWVLAANTYT
jgi:hypothetical protein